MLKDCRQRNLPKSTLIWIIVVTAVISVIYVDSRISSISFESTDLFSTHENSKILIHQNRIKSISRVQLLSMTDETERVETQNQDHLVPPINVTETERIEWFRRNLPEFKILKSSKLTQEFHSRVLAFFNNDCEVQFFMTWIAPAELFGKREALAMNSIFKLHPNGCVVIISTTMDSKRGYRVLKPLLDRGFKVLTVTPDLPFLFLNTPAESWFDEMKNGNKDPGEIPLSQNLSNLIRLAILYKYGGVYMDADFIVLKSFKNLRNSIGAQSIDTVSKQWTRLNNAVLVFDMNHPLLYKFIEEFAATFDGNKWGHNGPYLVSRVVRRVEVRAGFNFTVLPPMAFYPVYWNRVGSLFKKPDNLVDLKWVKAKLLQLSGETYGIHLWNKQSSRFRIEDESVLSRLISNQHKNVISS